jgi:dTDP-4-dehydrorhamnose 3,5-epimerase
VDLRRSSPSFGKWVGVELSAENKLQLWVPPGFGHAFLVRSAFADFLYKTTEYWMEDYDRSVRWNDPQIAVDWGRIEDGPLLAGKDLSAPYLDRAEVFP